MNLDRAPDESRSAPQLRGAALRDPDTGPPDIGLPDIGLQERWSTALRAVPGGPVGPGAVESLAGRLARLTVDGSRPGADADQAGRRISACLVREHLTSPATLRQALTVLLQPGTAPADRTAWARMAGALAAAHEAAVLQLGLERQESVHSTALAAREAADRARGDARPPLPGQSREEALEAELRHVSTHDALTGLPNRTLLLQRLDDALADPDPTHRVAVMCLDLDGFRFINDSRGHRAGDQVLVAVASRLVEVARAHGALLARLSGDEFVALVTGRGHRPRPAALAGQLLAALDRPVDVAGQRPVTVRASVGVAELPTRRGARLGGAQELLRAADLALHAAKEDGRGQVVVHEPTRTARQLSRFTVATSLPGVVERDELGLTYQPLTRLDTGELHGVEALLRWHHPRLGTLTPRLFILVAEETSLIVPIGRWVLQRALTDLAATDWPAVNINVSVRQLMVPSFADEVRRALADSGVEPSRLRLEVTEGLIMHLDDDGPIAVLRALADDGVRIVMDDFGTGYSNLAALRRLPLHELKLAGTFVQPLQAGTTPDPLDSAVLRTVVELAHTLGLTVTAEEVQTAEQDAWVRAAGCDVGQGWFYDDLPAGPRPGDR